MEPDRASRGVDSDGEGHAATFNAVPEVVDPEVRAYVYSLVSALGGTGADEEGRYVLGDDALACLKDLKRWLKLYDEKTNRLDVARCLAEANLVNGDLLEILASTPEDAMGNRAQAKINLACLELLVPLTWPIEKNDMQMTVNHHRHMPYLQQSQVFYKRGIITHDTAKILHRVVRIGLPSMALPLSDRTNRDEGIIRLVLYFIRNVAMISVPPKFRDESDENEVSRSATIDAFHAQDIFHLLLTLSSGMGEEFNTQDVVIMEALFHLLKGVDIEKLFLTSSQREGRKADELKDLMKREAAMHRGYARNAPTRHNRFGTMIWIKRDDERMSAVSGQDALLDSQRSLAKIDKTKRWKKPRTRMRKTDMTQNDFDLPIPLTNSATRHLRAFVEEFLDSAFNPLFNHIRKAIEREAERVLDVHPRQFFFLVSWFLEAERMRRKMSRDAHEEKRKTGEAVPELEADSFAIVASVLTQETFILLNRFMQESYDMKSWEDLNAGMRCFTQILHTVHEMSASPLDEDQTIAENIQNRIFYEETTHDRIVSIVRYYSNQGFGYLNACTELAHVHLRMLEHYSKQNVEMQVRSRRRVRKKKAAAEVAEGMRNHDDDDDEGSEGEDVARAQRTSSERKFDFKRFAAKFMTQACVDTFVALTRYYQDLTPEQLKRAHRFFYRVAFKMELSVMLFRIDIIALLNKMIKGPEGLDSTSAVYREWEELVRQVFKKLVRKMQDRSQLAVELLFSKINATTHFLEYGYEKQTASTQPRAPAELEVKPGMDQRERIGVAVALLVEQNKQDAVDWVKSVLSSAASERQSWEAEGAARASTVSVDDGAEARPDRPPPPSIAIKPDGEARRIALFKDNKLRLLMTLVGFQKLGLDDESDTTWVIPSTLSATDLSNALEEITKAETTPPVFEEGKSAEDMVRRKLLPKTRHTAFDEDSDHDDDGEEEFLFPAGGPTIQKADALDALKKKRRSRHKDDDVTEPMDEAAREARAAARAQADLERRRKIKSNLFIHDSDDEDDEERDEAFFREEAARREKQGREVLKALRQAPAADTDARGKKRKGGGAGIDSADSNKKKKRTTEEGDENDDDGEDGIMIIDSGSDAGSDEDAEAQLSSSDASERVPEQTETPLTSPQPLQSSQEELTARARSMSVGVGKKGVAGHRSIFNSGPVDDGEEEEEEEDEAPVAKTARRRVRAGFVIESDSE